MVSIPTSTAWGRIGETSTSGGWRYHLADVLGSVRQLADATGEVVFAQSYEPYGDVLHTFGDLGSAYGFTGEMQDASGLVYLRARYYNSGIGIFTARDPFSGIATMPKSYNPYQYAFNNPVLYTDPSGESVLGAAVLSIFTGAVTGLIAGELIGCSTWEAALSGTCGCDMQAEALEIGNQAAWNKKFALAGAVIGGLVPLFLLAGPAGAIFVGGVTVGMAVVDAYKTIQIMINETGVTACTVGRLILDFVGIISGAVMINKGIIQYRETGKWINIQDGASPNPNPADDFVQETPSSYKLGKNLENANIERPPNSTAHHIVAGKDPRAAYAREILTKFRVGINEADNGVYLPGPGGDKTAPYYHPGLHTDAYFRWVNNQMKFATEVTIRSILNQIRKNILSGTSP